LLSADEDSLLGLGAVTTTRLLGPFVRAAITDQDERLAAYRQVPLSGIDLDG
jgi:hypothetical protein